MSTNDASARAPGPWATLVTAAAALLVFISPAASVALIYDRGRIADGEWWRLLTGNWVHFSPSHLLWNLAVFLPAGAWAERLAPLRLRILCVLAPLFIGFVLFSFEPLLLTYAGLSGVAAAVVVLLGLTQLRSGEPDRWFWRTVLALVALKIVAEAALASPLLAHFPSPAVRSVPLAHLAGVVVALAVHGFGRRRVRG